MIIAIDLTYNPYGGSFSQIENIFKYIDTYKYEKYIIYCTHTNYLTFKVYESEKIIFKVSQLSSLSKVTRILWTQLLLPFHLLIDNVSVLFCPGNFSPIFAFTKKIQWIGTVGPFEQEFYKDFPFIGKINLLINKYMMIFSALTSKHVIFESKYTRDLFITNYFFDKSKSSVINLGRDDYFSLASDNNTHITKHYKSKNFLLAVSHLYPYKNLEVLLHAINKNNDPDLICLIAGKFHTKSYHQKLVNLCNELSLEEKIFFLGGVSKEELKELYSNCEIFIFTSPFENFAYTLVEAMSCGAAVVATNTTAMPETCQSAALYFNPWSHEELYQSITSLLSDHDLLSDYRSRSIKRSNEINTYKEANTRTSEIIHELISNE